MDHFVVVATAIDISLFRRIDHPDVDSFIRDFTNIIHVFLYISLHLLSRPLFNCLELDNQEQSIYSSSMYHLAMCK